MREAIFNTGGKRCDVTVDGVRIAIYDLYDGDGLALGEAVVTLDTRRRRLNLSVLGRPNAGETVGYGCQWLNYAQDGYKGFLLGLSAGYIADRMAKGHDERCVLSAEATRRCIAAQYRWDAMDADQAGAALLELEGCECEADFSAWAERFGIEDAHLYFHYGPGAAVRWLATTLLPALKQALQRNIQGNI